MSVNEGLVLTEIFQDIKAYMDKKYEGISGFVIPEGEFYSMMEAESSPVYGEIKYESVAKLAELIGFTNQDVFYDFGSGVGKVVIEIFLMTPAKKSVGIELSETRFHHSQKVRKKIMNEIKKGELFDFQKRLNQEYYAGTNPKRKVDYQTKQLQFQSNNFLKAKTQDATVIFISSLCFTRKLMQELTIHFSQLADGLRVISLTPLPAHPQFTLMQKITLPMSWTNHSQIYIYLLKNDFFRK